jgi:hypothetical protein
MPHRNMKTLYLLPELCPRAKILKFSITNINGTFAFARQLAQPTCKSKRAIYSYNNYVIYHYSQVNPDKYAVNNNLF